METRELTEAQWKNLKFNTFATAWAILQSAKVLIEHTKSPAFVKDNIPKVCTALYTHAVEEYGKLLYLSSLKPANGLVVIEYDSKFKNHSFKFNLALDNLPNKCTLVHEGSFDNASFSDSFSQDTKTEWRTRLTLFNTDFDESGNIPKHPIIDLKRLQEAVAEFEKVLWGMKY